MSELISKELIIEGLYVSLSYKNGDLIDITIQEKDGEVLFTGWPSKLQQIILVGKEVLKTED